MFTIKTTQKLLRTSGDPAQEMIDSQVMGLEALEGPQMETVVMGQGQTAEQQAAAQERAMEAMVQAQAAAQERAMEAVLEMEAIAAPVQVTETMVEQIAEMVAQDPVQVTEVAQAQEMAVVQAQVTEVAQAQVTEVAQVTAQAEQQSHQ